MAKNMHKKEFDQHTLVKLKIFRDFFREWFPVFIYSPDSFIEKIFIYDLFAGSGTDSEGTYGSPLILLKEAIGQNKTFCQKAYKKPVIFAFNDALPTKAKELQNNIDQFYEDCRKNCNTQKCFYENNTYVKAYDFRTILMSDKFNSILKNPKYGKFLLLDQYGFKHVTPDVFKMFINAPKTDFIFFIASSTIKRFQETDVVRMYLSKHNNIDFSNSKPKECHKVVADFFRSLIPENKEYYLHSFTLKHKSNYYGLIFGSAHSFGMEKFLKVCWKIDSKAGEAEPECNINDDISDDDFFAPPEPKKISDVKTLLRNDILYGRIVTNIEGLRKTLQYGCLPIIFVEVINELYENKRIAIDGKRNSQSCKIHDAKEYTIRVI